VNVFIAGGSGAIGRQLVPMLVQAGHHVVAMTRTAAVDDAPARLSDQKAKKALAWAPAVTWREGFERLYAPSL